MGQMRQAHPRPARYSGLPRFLRNNGLTIVLGALFAIFLAGQSVVGHRAHNSEQRAHGEPEVGYGQYVRSAHFLEAVTENWESEFLQMFGFVLLTSFLFQKGSAESKNPDEPEPVDRDPRLSRDKPDVPGPVRRGGLLLRLYENSLSLTFLLLFLASFALHAASGAREYSLEQVAHGESAVSVVAYLGTARFWFESLQNWQSEFLAIGAMGRVHDLSSPTGFPRIQTDGRPHSETGGG